MAADVTGRKRLRSEAHLQLLHLRQVGRQLQHLVNLQILTHTACE